MIHTADCPILLLSEITGVPCVQQSNTCFACEEVTPTKASVYDPSFDAEATRNWRITVDGIEQRQVILFDTLVGFVVKFIEPLTVDPVHDCYKTTLVKGKVEVT